MAHRRKTRNGSGQQRGAESTKIAGINQRLRGIWEREGQHYGEDVEDEDSLIERAEATVDLRKKSINKVIDDIRRSKTVDFCFLIDATGSMQAHIDGVRDSVNKVVSSLVQGQQSQSGILRLRFAVVAYRDVADNIPIECLEFNDQPAMCVNFCRHLVAKGGEDIPEDVFSGLDNAKKLQWAEDAGTRVIFHMADAPCHGRRYHDSELRDSYPNGDPNGRTEADLFESIKGLGIDYYFGKINSSTDRMVQLFEAAYGRPITTFDVQAITNITDSVICSISTSVDNNVEQSKLGTLRMKSKWEVRTFQLQSAAPKWDDVPVQIGSFLQYQLPQSMNDVENDVPLLEKEIRNVRVKLAEHPFAEGSERIAYFGLDLFQGYNTASDRGRGRGRGAGQRPGSGAQPGGPTEIVLKEYKFVGQKQNSLERYRTACEVQTVAFFLADEFNRQTGVSQELKFLKVKTLILQPRDNTLRVMSYERRLLGDGVFLKFTNNCDYSMQRAAEKAHKHGVDSTLLDLVMAFSHWTYHYSNGFLMIVDLQGQINVQGGITKVLMTDPAIHCRDTTRFAPLNLGKAGMKAFFDAHSCNPVCKKLGLLPGAKQLQHGN